VLIVTAMFLVGIQLVASAILLIEYIGNTDKLAIDCNYSLITTISAHLLDTFLFLRSESFINQQHEPGCLSRDPLL